MNRQRERYENQLWNRFARRERRRQQLIRLDAFLLRMEREHPVLYLAAISALGIALSAAVIGLLKLAEHQ